MGRPGRRPADLYGADTPESFWRLLTDSPPSAEVWNAAVANAAAKLPAAARAAGDSIESILFQTLGEAQFGPDHWTLTVPRQLYYLVKPILPRTLTRTLRQLHRRADDAAFPLGWPIEPRFARFQWEVIQQVLTLTGRETAPFIEFWPQGCRFAFVLTHDVETAEGQRHVRELADLDASYGFRSSFGFPAEAYPLDWALIEELRTRGFEITLHGLKHDGRLFASRSAFNRHAKAINGHLQKLGAVGFRAPLTQRHPEWLQELDIEYDLSFFDTDPYEPIPGGTMSVWPFELGRFIELPYTLVQDYTLTAVLGERTPRLWLEKVDFLAGYAGLALVNTHPDYLSRPEMRPLYSSFLEQMSERRDYWHALPREVARWWRTRAMAPSIASLPGAVEGTVHRPGDTSGAEGLPTGDAISPTPSAATA